MGRPIFELLCDLEINLLNESQNNPALNIDPLFREVEKVVNEWVFIEIE